MYNNIICYHGISACLKRINVSLCIYVQRRFTKRLKGMAKLQYCERLAILLVEMLEHRRLKAVLMYIYNIVFGLLDVEPGTLDITWKGGTSVDK